MSSSRCVIDDTAYGGSTNVTVRTFEARTNVQTTVDVPGATVFFYLTAPNARALGDALIAAADELGGRRET